MTAKLSRGVMVPIAILPLAGLLLGISASILTNLPSDTSAGWITFLNYLKACGSFIFENLPALFAISIAVAFSGDSGIAGFTSFVGWLMFNGLQNALISPHYVQGESGQMILTHYSALFWNYIPPGGVGNNLGIRSLQSSIFGGILIGGLAAYCYNRFHQLKLPSFLGFFAGTRAVPIIMITLLLPITLLFVMIWPVFALVLNYMGVGLGRLSGAGNINSLLFGYIERSLIPFGVHHAYYAPLWYSAVGGEIVLSAPALIGVETEGGFTVYKVIGTLSDQNIVSDNLVTWKDVLGALNPQANLESISSPDNWQGDNRYFQQLNAYMVGKQLHLARIFGQGPETLDYTLTYKTFSTSTFNRAAAVALYTASGEYTPVREIERLLTNGSQMSQEDFLPAFQAANIGAYQQGKFAFMIFGIPAAAAAMVVAAPKENRKQTFAIVGSAALTSFLTGITEPFEFTFLFASPVLFWGVHATFCALSFWLTAFLGANIGQTFSGGVLDLIIYGVVPDIALGAKANSYIPVIVGLLFIPLYFFTFLFFIRRFNIATPGRGGELISKQQYQALKQQAKSAIEPEMALAFQLVEAYGGGSNIQAVDSCITKLRVTVVDPEKIDTQRIVELGASGRITSHDNYIVAIFGTISDTLKVRMQKIVSKQVDVDSIKTQLKQQTKSSTSPTPSQPQPLAQEANTPQTTEQKTRVLSPSSGTIKLLEELEDESFNLLGRGVAVEPEDEEFTSPVEGVLELIYPAGHAYIFDSNNFKILVHVGIETVRINNRNTSELLAFRPLVKTGEKVQQTTKFLKVDWEFIENFAKELTEVRKTTPIIVLNESLKPQQTVKLLVQKGQKVKMGQPLFEIE